jgi:TPR repeat protein
MGTVGEAMAMHKRILTCLVCLLYSPSVFADPEHIDSWADQLAAAERGNPVEQVTVGTEYHEGRVIISQQGRLPETNILIPKNDEEAVKWWPKVVEQGDSVGLLDAQFQLGTAYRDGEGVPRYYVQGYR